MSLLFASLLLSLLAFAAGWLATRRDPAGSISLSLAFILSLLFLPLFLLLPKFTIEIGATKAQTEAISGTTLPLLGLVWFLGFAASSFFLTRDYFALRRWFQRSKNCEDREILQLLEKTRRGLEIRPDVKLRICQSSGSPCIAGLLHPTIYLPAESQSWSRETLEMVFLHELSHYARRDLWTSLTARLACLVHWFNPVVWRLRRHLLAQCEYACDAHVISKGADPHQYANALCDVAESGQHTVQNALAMAGSAPLRSRVERLDHRPSRRSRWIFAATTVLALSTALGLSIVRFAPQKPAETIYSPEETELRLSADPFPAD